MELAAEFADDVRSSRSRRPAQALRHDLEQLGTSLEPLHPRTDDRNLARYFLARVPADRLPAALARLTVEEGVVSAYVKPIDETP